MKCSRCYSTNISISLVNKSKTKRKGILYWLFIGFWLEPLMWIFLTIPMLLLSVFRVGKKTKIVTHKMAICQQCGKTWRVL